MLVRLRLRRKLTGLSQDALGKRCGVTFQQIQKYERGTNSTSTRRLHEFAAILNVPLMYFFEGYTEGTVGLADASKQPHISTQAQHLMQDFLSLPVPLQNSVSAFVRELAKNRVSGRTRKKAA